MPLIKSELKPLAKSVLKPLELTTTASAIDAAIQKKIFGTGARLSDLAKQTILIMLNRWYHII